MVNNTNPSRPRIICSTSQASKPSMCKMQLILSSAAVWPWPIVLGAYVLLICCWLGGGAARRPQRQNNHNQHQHQPRPTPTPNTNSSTPPKQDRNQHQASTAPRQRHLSKATPGAAATAIATATADSRTTGNKNRNNSNNNQSDQPYTKPGYAEVLQDGPCQRKVGGRSGPARLQRDLVICIGLSSQDSTSCFDQIP